MKAWLYTHRLQVGAIFVGVCLLLAGALSRVGTEDGASAPATPPVGAPIAPTPTSAPEGEGTSSETAAPASDAGVADEPVAVDPDRIRLPTNPSGARDRRTEEGVRQAGIDYASTVQQRLVYLDDGDGTAVLLDWKAPGVESDELAVTIETAKTLRTALAAGGGAAWWSVSPVGATVTTYSQGRARVEVWVTQVVGSSIDPIEGGSAFVPTVDFHTASIDFVWDTERGWSVWEFASTPGPVPMLATTAVQSAPAEFFDATAGYMLVQEHR